jgi:diguanylate cyclase (GGDEF)-like protein
MAGCDNVFRMGGDEFIIVIDDMNRQRTTEFIDELKHRIHAEGISMAFGASLHKTPIDDIDAIITEADRAMYRDKKHPRK